MEAFSIRHDTIAAETARLHALSADLAESAGYANVEIMASLLKRDHKSWLQAVVKEQKIIAALSLSKGPVTGVPHRSWITPLMSTGRPSFTSEADKTCFKTLLDSIKTPLILAEIPSDSLGFSLLKTAASHHQVLRQWQRACLHTTGTFDGWMTDNFDHKRRKELKRLRARLSEQGQLVSDRLGEGNTLESFISDFLRLEAGGWKGQRGSALEQNADLTTALREGLAQLHRSGKLRFWRLTLDGKAIAALFAIVECGVATLGKIAYDEAHAKYSPGVLLILDATGDFFADPAVSWADSNAVPDHPMINRIWRDRVTMTDIAVAGRTVSKTRFAATIFAENLRATLRNSAKTLYYRIQRK